MSWKKVKLKEILRQYRIEHLVQNDTEYKQVTISKYDGVTFRGTKMGREIGRKRQFQIDLKKFPNTLMFVRQGVQDGSIGIAPIEVDGCIATENMPMFSVQEINLEYFKFLLKSPYFYDELNKIQTTGSAQKSIHEREILEIEIPFPDIEEQEGIAQQLSSKKDNSLEISTELTHQLTLVKKLRQQLLQDAVQGKLVEQNPDDEPASELLKKIKAEKTKLIAEKKLKKEKDLPPIKPEEIPFEIPENWVWCRLGDAVNLKRGKSKHRPRNDNSLFENGTYPFIQTGDVARSKANGYLIETINGYYNDFGLSQSLMQKKGTLCITIAANIAECGFLSFDACAPDSIVCLTALDSIIEKYCFFYVIQAREDIEKYAPATAQKNINLEILNSLIIPLPPLSEQNRIVQKLDELMQHCNELEASIKQSESQNEKLLQQVLREALRPVPEDVEKEPI
jgi:type I restriction enzyme S subunit